MLDPDRPDEQARLDELRYDADMAISRLLRAAADCANSRIEVMGNLDCVCGVLHNDIRIYRRRLLERSAERPRPPRHLHVVPTSAAVTEAALGLRLRNEAGQ